MRCSSHYGAGQGESEEAKDPLLGALRYSRPHAAPGQPRANPMANPHPAHGRVTPRLVSRFPSATPEDLPEAPCRPNPHTLQSDESLFTLCPIPQAARTWRGSRRRVTGWCGRWRGWSRAPQGGIRNNFREVVEGRVRGQVRERVLGDP